MRRLPPILLQFGLLGAAALGCLPAQAAHLYALVNGANAVLEEIDTATSAVTPIGPTGVYVNFGDLASSASPGSAYMVDGRQAAGVNSGLYTLNLATGAATLIGDTGVPDMFGLAFDPDTSTLFGTTYSTGAVGLYSLDAATGAATFIGATSISNSTKEIDALTYDTATHSLVGISTGSSSLYSINEQSGALTLLALLQPTGLSVNHNIGDLAYDPVSNRFFSADVGGFVYVTDPSAPVFNDVAIVGGLGNVDGLVAAVPEPSAGLLMSTGCVCLSMVSVGAWRHRRCESGSSRGAS